MYAFWLMQSLNTSKCQIILVKADLVLQLWYWWCFVSIFFNFNWRLITLQHCGGFCHTITWISHGCTCVPPPEPPSHHAPHPIPQDCPSAPALSALSHASNLDLRSLSHMVIYMFQCYSLKSPTLAFSHRVQKSVLYICVSKDAFLT